MKQKIYDEYLPFLAKNHGVLLLSNEHLDIFEEIKSQFSAALQRNITPSALEHITNTLIHSSIDLVIIDTSMEQEILEGFVHKINDYDAKIKTLLIYDKTNSQEWLSVAQECDLLMERSTCNKLFVEKIFLLLSLDFTIQKLSQQAVMTSRSSDSHINDMDEFFDTYEGISLFLIEDLSSICKSMRDGELSDELIKLSSAKLNDIAEVFSHHDRMKSIEPILKNLAQFLANLDLSTLEPSSLKAFDYLVAILDDISSALLNIFVDRIFTDVYIIEHSLENNIDFMENALMNVRDNSSELDFF